MEKETQATTIVVAISSKPVRQGIQSLLELEPDISVIGEATNGIEVMNIVTKLHPRVLIIELMIGGVNDLELIEEVSKLSPVTNVVVFSLYNAAAFIKEVFRAGAKAYVLKESPSYELIYAIRQAAAGHYYISPSLSDADSVG